MKEFLLQIKNIESDFVLNDKAYRSKIELGVTSLITADYSKAKDMFDAAIELDSDMPVGWLGKCFAELAVVKDEDFNELMLDEYINRALRKTDELMNYRAAMCGCLIYRHTHLINKYLDQRKKAKLAEENAANNAGLAVGAAGLGAALTGSRNSVASNIVGGALITGGIATALVENANINYFKNQGNKYDYLLMYQCLISSPIAKFSALLSDRLENHELADLLKLANENWNKSLNLVLKEELFSLVDLIHDLNIDKLFKLVSKHKSNPFKRLFFAQSIIKGETCPENIALQEIICDFNNSDAQQEYALKVRRTKLLADVLKWVSRFFFIILISILIFEEGTTELLLSSLILAVVLHFVQKLIRTQSREIAGVKSRLNLFVKKFYSKSNIVKTSVY
ncbi:MAG: hypothetical protein RLY85_2305 [Bacteroidota bacterium]